VRLLFPASFCFSSYAPHPSHKYNTKLSHSYKHDCIRVSKGCVWVGPRGPSINLEYSQQCREPDRYFGASASGWVLSSYSVCQCVYWFWASNGKLIPVLQYALCTDACRCRAALLQEHTATHCNISLQSASLSLRPRGVVQPCCKNTLQHTATIPCTVHQFL